MAVVVGSGIRRTVPQRRGEGSSAISVSPSAVRIDSGWNWKPSTGCDRCRRPMITPSSDQAVTSSSAGNAAVLTASE